MRSVVLLAAICATSSLVYAQGSGTPSPQGQSVSAEASASAERAVEARHQKVVARSEARAAKRAARSASASGA